MNIDKISIRGRVALSIFLLERYLESKGNLKDWIFLLEKLWKFTSYEYLDEWQSEIVELLPDSILEFKSYEASDIEFLSKSEYLEIKALYQKQNKKLPVLQIH